RPAAGTAALRNAGVSPAGPRASRSRLLPRQREAERAARIERRLDTPLTAVRFDDPLREVQPVAGAAAARFVELEAEVENLMPVAGIDADAVVAHADPITVAVARAVDRDLPLALRPIVEGPRV